MLGYRNTVVSRFGMVAGAMAIAVGIGAVMQKGDSAHLAALYAKPDTAQAVDAAVTVADVATLDPVSVEPVRPVAQAMVQLPKGNRVSQPLVTGIQMTSSDPAAIETTQPMSRMRSTPSIQTVATGCAVSMTADPAPAAMIDLAISVPCLPQERVVLHHEGMMFTVQTDDQGRVDISVPALSPASVIMASFADGTSAMTPTETPSLNFYDRVVLQWQGDAGLQVHAFEFGATYNQDGHVWAGRPQTVAATAAGEGGFIMQLGATDGLNPMVAEVYTFPSGLTARPGAIGLNVEAEITRENCERAVAAQTLQYTPDAGVTIQDLSFTIPTCQAIGEFLVLNNLLEPVNLAQR
ncbi:MAG: hypothetical protein AAF386_00530 [Pseudomonadota bacterium]